MLSTLLMMVLPAAGRVLSAVSAAEVAQTGAVFDKSSERLDVANLELRDAMGAAAKANLAAANSDMAAGLAGVAAAWSPDDASPSPPPWYVMPGSSKAAAPLARSTLSHQQVLATAAAADAANARRDQKNEQLMVAMSNAANLNSLSMTQNIAATFAAAANAFTPYDPAPPPPPIPAAPGYGLGAEIAPVEKVEKVFGVAEAEAEETSERLKAAQGAAAASNTDAVVKTVNAIVPVLKAEIQKLFPSPSPPPPPFTASIFGQNLFMAAISGDALAGSKTLDGGASFGMGMGQQRLDSADGLYKLPAKAANAAIHAAIDKPPSPPSAEVVKAAQQEAVSKATKANAELIAATEAAASAQVELAKAALSASYTAAEFRVKTTLGVEARGASAESESEAEAPAEKSFTADVGAHAAADGAVEADRRASVSNDQLSAAVAAATDADVDFISSGAAHANAVVKDQYDHIFGASSPSPSPPPFNGKQFGKDLWSDALNGDAFSGFAHLHGGVSAGKDYGKALAADPKRTAEGTEAALHDAEDDLALPIGVNLPLDSPAAPADASVASGGGDSVAKPEGPAGAQPGSSSHLADNVASGAGAVLHSKTVQALKATADTWGLPTEVHALDQQAAGILDWLLADPAAARQPTLGQPASAPGLSLVALAGALAGAAIAAMHKARRARYAAVATAAPSMV